MEFSTNTDNSYFRCAVRALLGGPNAGRNIGCLFAYKGVTVSDLEWLIAWMPANSVTPIMSSEIMEHISKHILVDMDFIDRFPDANWPFHDMQFNIMSNPNITMDVVRSRPGPHPDWVWDSAGISSMSVITMEFVLWAQTMFEFDSNDWEALSRHQCITFADIRAHPELPWCNYNVSQNENVTDEIVLANLDYDWDFVVLSERDDIPVEFILEHSSIDLDDQSHKFLRRLLNSDQFDPKTMLNFDLFNRKGLDLMNELTAAIDRIEQQKEIQRVVSAKLDSGQETNWGFGNNIAQFLQHSSYPKTKKQKISH